MGEDRTMKRIVVVGSFPLPEPDRRRLIWQPVTDVGPDEPRMRLAPMDWQPSGAHHALEHLARERDDALARLAASEEARERAEGERDRLAALTRAYLAECEAWERGDDGATIERQVVALDRLEAALEGRPVPTEDEARQALHARLSPRRAALPAQAETEKID